MTTAAAGPDGRAISTFSRGAHLDPVGGQLVGPEPGEHDDTSGEREQKRATDQQAVDDRPDLTLRSSRSPAVSFQRPFPCFSAVPTPTHDTAGARDLEVEHHDLWPGGREARDRLVPVGRHGDDVEAGVLQVALHGVAPHRVVVDDHHAEPGLGLLAHAVGHSPTLTSVPATAVLQRVIVVADHGVLDDGGDQGRPSDRPLRSPAAAVGRPSDGRP